MSSLLKAKDAVKKAVKAENNRKIDEAIDNYANAVRHFRSALIIDEKEIEHFKAEVENEIKFYLKRINKLEMLQLLLQKNEEQCVGSEQCDILSSDEQEIAHFKAENEGEIKCYLKLINRLEVEVLLLKQKLKQSLGSWQNNIENENFLNNMDIKICNRIKSTILTQKPNVKFADVCGLEILKNDLIQAALLPLKQPQVFSSNTKPYKGFLLFGPPGTGKAFIAKALAGEIHGTKFFSISVGNVLSKYVGESESYIRNLFKVARDEKPSIIFFDEIDAFVIERSDAGHNSCRGVLTELLVQMDGLQGSNEGILVIAATNKPHHIDNGILRRFDKLIYVPLPNTEDRCKMFKNRFPTTNFSDHNFDLLASKTSGFSGSYIDNVCNTANNMALERLVKCCFFKVFQDGGKYMYVPCDSDIEPDQNKENDKKKIDIMKIPNGSVYAQPVAEFNDVVISISESKPSVLHSDLYIYEKFVEERVGYRRAEATTPNPNSTSFNVVNFFHNLFF